MCALRDIYAFNGTLFYVTPENGKLEGKGLGDWKGELAGKEHCWACNFGFFGERGGMHGVGQGCSRKQDPTRFCPSSRLLAAAPLWCSSLSTHLPGPRHSLHPPAALHAPSNR